MNSVTNKYIWFKCYLTLSKIVADGMRSFKRVSDSFKCFLLVFGEKNKENYNCFFTVTEISLSSVLTSQDNLSLSPSSNIPAISDGIVVLNDLDLGFCNITFDFTSNNFIHSFLSFVINIFVNKVYIFYLQSIYK